MNEDFPEYPCEIRPLSESEGFLIVYPDLPGCMSDGVTVEEALANGRDAVKGWILTAREFGDPVPAPGSGGEPGLLSSVFLNPCIANLPPAPNKRA